MRRPSNRSRPAKASPPADPPPKAPATASVPPKTSAPTIASPRCPAWLIALVLGLATAALYWPATRHGFVMYDDPTYVMENAHVTGGWTPGNVGWAFRSGYAANWHPVTWLSHMLDCELFGLKPWGHHLTSVLLHAADTVLVFLLLLRLTGATWRSATVAALFGWHPLHVESVAWIAERKDVLSTFFGLLSLYAYTRYAADRNIEHRTKTGKFYYGLALLFFALGLMSKPMLVTWPFVMLLLDWWPLGRMTNSELRMANLRAFAIRNSTFVIEKIPFLALAAGSCVVTFLVQKNAEAVVAVQKLYFGERAGNAVISCCRYLEKLFWPEGLAIFYPHPGQWPVAEVLLAGGLVAGITVIFFLWRRRCPFLLMGWLWYLGTLVPVIGLVQVGSQAMADRYMYIPSLGILIVVVWGAWELTRNRRHPAVAMVLAGSAAGVLCLGLTWRQLGYWATDEALIRHALEVTENNYVALCMYGTVLDREGRTDDAIRQYYEAIRVNPAYVYTHLNLGIDLNKGGRFDEAIAQFQEAIRLQADFAAPHYNLGIALGREGRIDDAIQEYQEAIRLEPGNADAYNNLGNALGRQGRLDEAIGEFQQAIRLDPDNADSRYNLGLALDKKGRVDEAISQFQEAIRLEPQNPRFHTRLGNTFLNQGRIDEAIGEFQEAVRLNPDDAGARNNLAHALELKNAPTAR